MTVFKNTKAFSSFSVDDLEKAEFYGNTLGIDILPNVILILSYQDAQDIDIPE